MSFFHPHFIPPHLWKWLRWPLWFTQTFVILFLIGLAARAPFTLRNDRSARMVPIIAQQHITPADVLGTNLPPKPDPSQVDTTVQGIDANHNGIRDDVELAIFAAYPTNMKVRAAELQYAFALQMYFERVFSEGTLQAVNEQNDRGSSCLWDTVPTLWKTRAEATQELSTQMYVSEQKLTDEVKAWVLNTKERKDFQTKMFDKYYHGGRISKAPSCDIDTTALTN